MSQSKSLWLRWKLPYVAVIGVVFALFMVLGRPTPVQKTPEVMPPQGQFSQSIVGIGVIEPKSEIIAIGVELSGVVRDVPAKVGEHVNKGDVLFALDKRDIDAQILVLEKSLAAAKVQAEDANAQFSIVSSMQDKRAVAKDDFNKRKFGKEFAAARVEEIKAQLTQAKTTKERLTIKAPIEGDVLEVNIRLGEFASAGALAQPLMRLGDNSTRHVRVEIDEENAAHINPESKAEGLLRGNTSKRIPLTFVRFEPYVKPKQNLAVAGQRVDTRVLQIIYALPQDAPHSFVGQQMDVFVDAAEAK